jgi:hypothetical protein
MSLIESSTVLIERYNIVSETDLQDAAKRIDEPGAAR